MTDNLQGQVTIYDLDGWSGKMSQEHSVAIKEKTSKPSSRKSSGSQTRMPQMCLCLSGGGGQNLDVCIPTWDSGRLLGEYTMLSFGESPREGRESHLSQILMDSVPEKYSLSEKACLGILNRAAKKGKDLPEVLKQALENQICRGDISDSQN